MLMTSRYDVKLHLDRTLFILWLYINTNPLFWSCNEDLLLGHLRGCEGVDLSDGSGRTGSLSHGNCAGCISMWLHETSYASERRWTQMSPSADRRLSSNHRVGLRNWRSFPPPWYRPGWPVPQTSPAVVGAGPQLAIRCQTVNPQLSRSQGRCSRLRGPCLRGLHQAEEWTCSCSTTTQRLPVLPSRGAGNLVGRYRSHTLDAASGRSHHRGGPLVLVEPLYNRKHSH